MDFTFIEHLRLYLENSDVFGWKFIMGGCKALALALLLFKILEVFVSSTLHTDEQAPRVASLFNIFGYAFFIMSSDWIVGAIESMFSMIDSNMYGTPSNLYVELAMAIEQHNDDLLDKIGFLDMLSMPIDTILTLFYGALLSFLITLLKIADLAMTAGYLIARLFLLQLMKLLFPLVIALSTLDITKDLLGKWIKRYIGLFLLGLAYIGIINFCSALQDALLLQFKTYESGELMGMGHFIYGACITVVVVFTFKVKMFGTATSYINSLFS